MNFGKAFFIISGLVIIIIPPIVTIITEIETRCPSFGDACNPSYNQPCCGQHLVCISSKFTNQQHECLCDVDYEWIDNKCLQISDRFCFNNYDCRDRKYTKCSEDSKCTCESNYAKVDFSTCRPLIGSFCERDIECFPDNSVCLNERCHCADGFISLTNENCVPTFLELSCESGEEECQEAEFLLCDQEKCFCPMNHVMVDGRNCLPLLNEICSQSKPCAVNNSDCVNYRCKCDSNFVAQSNNRCFVTLLYGKCKNDDDCSNIKNSKCSKYNVCVCKTNFLYHNETTCISPLGRDCTTNADCSIGNSTCVDLTCQCRPYFENKSNERCVPVLTKPCRTNSDCFEVPFAECSTNKTCVCKSNYVRSENGSCLPPVVGICTKNSDCTSENSYCYFNRCQCTRNFVGQIINGVFECKKIRLGSSCETAYDCGTIKNSKCSHDRICVCHENYYALDDGITCVPGIGGYCSGDIDCAFANFRCFDHFCKCQQDYVSVSDSQCVLKSSAVFCNLGIECGEHWHSGCSSDHTCFCKTNNTLVNQATCSAILGGACWKDDQCTVKNSVCFSFRCQCKEPAFKAVAINMCL